MLRRIGKDAVLQGALRQALIATSLSSEKASFTALLLRAGAIDAELSAHIATQISLARTPVMPDVGFDIVAQAYQVVEHVLVEALS